MVMKMFITKFLNIQPQKHYIELVDVDMEMDQVINLAMWIS
jgi:hypothetical protein